MPDDISIDTVTPSDSQPLPHPNRADRRHQTHEVRRQRFRRQTPIAIDPTLEDTDTPPERLLKRQVVLARVGGISPETLWRWVRNGEFPRPVILNPAGNLLAWRETEVTAWIEARQQGHGNRPIAAWAEIDRRRAEREAARQAENVRNGLTPKFGMRRGN